MNIISDNMREFWRQEARDPVAIEARIKFLVEWPGVIDDTIAKQMDGQARVQVVSEWQKFFGIIRLLYF